MGAVYLDAEEAMTSDEQESGVKSQDSEWTSLRILIDLRNRPSPLLIKGGHVARNIVSASFLLLAS